MQIDDNCTAGPEPRYASSDFIDCFMAGDCMSQSGRDALGSDVESPTGPRTLKNNSAILKQLSCLIVGSQNESSGRQFVTGSNNPSSLESSIRGKGPQPATCNMTMSSNPCRRSACKQDRGRLRSWKPVPGLRSGSVCPFGPTCKGVEPPKSFPFIPGLGYLRRWLMFSPESSRKKAKDHNRTSPSAN